LTAFPASALALCLALAAGAGAAAQPREAPPPSADASVAAPIPMEASREPFTLTFANRPIVVLRARVLGRSPGERAEGAGRVLDDLVARRVTAPVAWRPFQDGALVTVAERAVVMLTTGEVDELLGETIDAAAEQTVARLRQALDEAVEARTPGMLLRSAALAGMGFAVGLFAVWGIARTHRAASNKLVTVAEQTVTRSGLADLHSLRASRLLEFERRFVTVVAVGLALVVTYATATFVLRRFPYTRPWGESMRAFLLASTEQLALQIVHAVPGLFSVLLICIVARFTVRLIRMWFNAVERGTVTPRWIYPETAQPTRRLLTALVWITVVVMAYPYLPGSQTEAFKGVSVILGLMVTFGSSGIVNQIMSGFMITYSRALRLGDFVRIGDVEGTVTQLGVLSTKVRTLQREEVTIPNAVVVGQTTTDYSRYRDAQSTLTPTSVTIGYDAPWRQVQSLLLLAAERTSGIQREPAPIVLQTALQDFYVSYTLFVCLESQESRLTTLHALHAHIQDLFNEYGVQIMSPNYLTDPAAPKVVARRDWFAAPARPDPSPQDGV